MNDIQKLQEISRLLDEAYKHYFSYEGHCKSAEGQISVEYGTFWDREDAPEELNIKSVSVYSYALGPNRSHDFDSVDEALETVREWHAREMEYDPNTPEAIENREEMDRIAGEFLSTMMEKGKLTIIDVAPEEF